MYSSGRENGESAIKQEENASGIDASVGHVKLVEVKYENECLKSQTVGQSNLHFASEGHARLKEIEVRGNGTRELQEQIESLNRELLLETQTRNAAEEALKHLQEVYSKADAKVQEITTRLAEAQQKRNQEMSAWDGENAELDSTLNRLHEHANVQDAQRANESCTPETEKQAQPQIQDQCQLPPIWPSASSSSSSSDSSSDESKNEHGEPSNANLESEKPWGWLEDWVSEESDDYPAMVALTELLRHAEKVSKQVKDLESVNPYRSSNAFPCGRHHHERAREMMRGIMRKKIWNYFGTKVITGLLRHAERLSEQMKPRQPKRKRAPVDLRAPGKGSRKS